jgi:hypothetical protein
MKVMKVMLERLTQGPGRDMEEVTLLLRLITKGSTEEVTFELGCES